jgi:hypothetical protein
VSFLLTVVGVLLLLVGALLLLLSLAGVGFGLFMALDQRTREPGVFFALWWIPAVAAAGGILMRDLATFTIGTFCFAVAGVAYALEHRGSRRLTRDNRTSSEDAKKCLLRDLLFEKVERWSKRARHRLFEKAQAYLPARRKRFPNRERSRKENSRSKPSYGSEEIHGEDRVRG